MNRAECEAKLAALMIEAWEVYKQYNPEGEYLTMDIINGKVSANNSYWAEDKEKPIQIWSATVTEEGETE